MLGAASPQTFTEAAMFFHNGGKLQYPVRVTTPDPLFARMLQQAIGGVEGEIRVAMQYMFQAWGSRGPKKYRDLLLETATEEIGHIEMLSPVDCGTDAFRYHRMLSRFSPKASMVNDTRS